MDTSWIKTEDETQEIWAKRYLLKKKGELTRSSNGHLVAKCWEENTSALLFLKSFEREELLSVKSLIDESARSEMMVKESVSTLLRQMKVAWNQRVIANQSTRQKSVKLSMKNFNWLKKYAAKNRKTHILVLDEILQNVQNEVKNARSESTKTINDLKMKIEELEATSDKLREQIDSLTKENGQLVQKNLTELVEIDKVVKIGKTD